MRIQERLNKVLAYMVSNKKAMPSAQHIREEIFHNEIDIDTAKHLLLKIAKDGYAKSHKDMFIEYTLDTELFLEEGGYGGIYNKQRSVNVEKVAIPEQPYDTSLASESLVTDPIDHDVELDLLTIFVSYAWADESHQKAVWDFVNELRRRGFNANLDKALSQSETSINFKKMMLKGMQHDKVIVVLSPLYKKKADQFEGGVGTEFQLLINDIDKNPKKYILVSFDGISDDIVPFGLLGNEIIDLSRPGWDEKLERKITGQDKYVLAPVATVKKSYSAEPIGKFQPVKPQNVVKMMEPTVRSGASSSLFREYDWVAFDVILQFKNISPDVLAQFTYTVNFKTTLLNDLDSVIGPLNGYTELRFDVGKKLFAGMVHTADPLALKVRWHNLKEIISSKITVEVFTEFGAYKHEYIAGEFLQVRRSGDTYGPLIPLNQAPFKSRF